MLERERVYETKCAIIKRCRIFHTWTLVSQCSMFELRMNEHTHRCVNETNTRNECVIVSSTNMKRMKTTITWYERGSKCGERQQSDNNVFHRCEPAKIACAAEQQKMDDWRGKYVCVCHNFENRHIIVRLRQIPNILLCTIVSEFSFDDRMITVVSGTIIKFVTLNILIESKIANSFAQTI